MFPALWPLIAVAAFVLALLAWNEAQALRREKRKGAATSELPNLVAELTRRVYSLEKKVEELTGIRASEHVSKSEIPDTTAKAPPPPTSTLTSDKPKASPEPASGPPASKPHEPTQPTIPASPAPRVPPVPRPAPAAHSIPIPYPATPLTFAHTPPDPDADLESRIGGRLANRIGIILLIFGVSFFLKLAFDNNWIGPAGRITIGILIGIALLPWSDHLRKKGYTYFSEGIAGLGAATLYLSTWAGWHYYALFTRELAFIAMIAVTAVLALISLRRDSLRLAMLCLVGGFLTPILLSNGTNSEGSLFSYLLVLDAGLLWMAVRKEWKGLGGVSLILTQLYFWGWYLTYYRPLEMGITLFFSTLFFVVYAAVPPARVRIWKKVLEEDYLLLFGASLFYFGSLFSMLWNRDRDLLTFLTLLLAAVHLGLAWLVARDAKEEAFELRTAYFGLAILFATATIPIKLSGNWIAIAFAIEAATLLWVGFQRDKRLLRAYGYALFAATVARNLAVPPRGGALFLNERFLTYLIVVACLAVAAYAGTKFGEALLDWEGPLVSLLNITANVYALAAISFEVTDNVRGDYFQGLWLIGIWSIYAAALFAFGAERKSPLLRWQGLVLFAFVFFATFLLPLFETNSHALSPFLNRRFLTYMILVGSLAAVLWFGFQRRENLGDVETKIVALFSVLIHLYAIYALSVEVWNLFANGPGGFHQSSLAQHLALTVLWTTYAGALFGVGVKKQNAWLRWQALVLLGVVVVKVLFYDISYLEKFYRVLSFLLLGIVLVIVSFLYERKFSRER